MTRNKIKAAMIGLTAAVSVVITHLSRKPADFCEYDTALVPKKGEILLVNTATGGRLCVPASTGGSARVPAGFFTARYIPETFTEEAYMYKEAYYINTDNIDDFDTPIKTEVNDTGVFMLFETNRPYDKQVLSHTVYHATAPHSRPQVNMICENTIKPFSDIVKDFGGYKKVLRGSCMLNYKVERYYHPLFDMAFLINKTSAAYDYWEFVGYKHLAHPITYYDFDGAAAPITDDDLLLYLNYGDMVEYSISFYVSDAPGDMFVMGRNELMDILDSIEPKVKE